MILLRIGLIAACGLTAALPAAGQRPEPRETEVHGHTMFTLLEPGDIPAIFDPVFRPVSQAESLYYPEEPLLVVAEDGTAKAYSTWHLDGHEVVNDSLNGSPIAATW